MKSTSFSKLAIGQQFEFQDCLYIKISPVIARGVDDDAQRLIPRSAQVVPHTNIPQTLENSRSDHLDPRSVETAQNEYHQACMRVIEELASEISGSNFEPALAALKQAGHTFRTRLGLPIEEPD